MTRLLFFLAMFWLPLDKVWVMDVGFMTITGYYILISALTIIQLAALLLGRARFKLDGVDLALAAVCVIYLCSTLLADDTRVAGLLAFNAIFIPTLTYFTAKSLLTDETALLRGIFSGAAGLAVLAIVGIGDFVATGARPTPLQQDGISMSTLAVLPLMVGLYAAKHIRMRSMRFGLVGLGVLTMGLSLARVYWIFTALSPIVVRLFRKGSALYVAVVVLAASLVLTLLVTIGKVAIEPTAVKGRDDQGIERVLNLENWKAAIYNRVVSMYQPSLDTFMDKPFLGQGLFVHKYQATTTHNFHLEWLESGGVLGYLMFTALYVCHFARIARRAREDALLRAVGVGSLAILVNGLTNGIMHSVMPTCLMLCLGMASARLQHVPGVQRVPRRTVWAPPGPGGLSNTTVA